MTTFEISFYTILGLIVCILWAKQLTTKSEVNRSLIGFLLLLITILLFCLCISLNINLNNRKNGCPEYEKVENVYKLKE